MIETTVNFKAGTMLLLGKARVLTGIARNHLIRMAVQEEMVQKKKEVVSFTRIRYQERNKNEMWKRFHLCLTERDYELMQDIRKIYKMSISRFIAMAVESHLKAIIQKIRKKIIGPDNYPITCYSLIGYEGVRGEIIWRIHWGVPEALP
jgi:hypothetical protein